MRAPLVHASTPGLTPQQMPPLTRIVLHQSLESGEGGAGGDVIASFIQGADLIVFDHLSLGGHILHRQGKGT